MPSSRKLLLILTLVPLLLYVPILRFPFMWDDGTQIVNNEVLRDPSRLLEIVTSSTFDSGGGKLIGAFYRPLVSLSYFVDYQLWGLNPAGYHILQILLHIAAGILLFLVMSKILQKAFSAEVARTVSFITTLFFLVHPVQVESVVYIACVGEIMYTLCALGGFAVLVNPWSSKSDPVPSNLRIILYFLFVFIGLFAKETTVVIIPITAWYLWLFVRPRWRFWLSYIAGSVASVGLYCWIRFGIAHVAMQTTFLSTISQASFGERLMTMPFILFRYISTLIVPYRLLIYQNDVVHSMDDIRFWGSTLILIALAGLILYYLKPKASKLEYFFLGWFLFGIAPVAGLLGLDMTIAERWLYFPSIGLLFFLACIVQRYRNKIPVFASALLYILVIMMVAFVARTLVRMHDWRSEYALYGHDIRYVSDSYELMNSLSVQLIDLHRYDEAQPLLERALALNANWFPTYLNLGIVYEYQGKTEQAIDMYLESIRRNNLNFAYANLVNILINAKRYDEARSVLDLALQKFPTYKRLLFLQIKLDYLLGDKSAALAHMEVLLKKGVLDRDIQEFVNTADQLQTPQGVLKSSGAG